MRETNGGEQNKMTIIPKISSHVKLTKKKLNKQGLCFYTYKRNKVGKINKGIVSFSALFFLMMKFHEILRG